MNAWRRWSYRSRIDKLERMFPEICARGAGLSPYQPSDRNTYQKIHSDLQDGTVLPLDALRWAVSVETRSGGMHHMRVIGLD